MSRLHSERGVALLMTAFLAVLLVGIFGLAVDVGYFYYIRSRMQVAADAAAVAAAIEVKAGRPQNLYTAAYESSALNGMTNGGDGLAVVVNSPPTTGSNSGKSNFVEVYLNKDQPTFFLHVFDQTLARLQVRSVAGPGPSSTCIHVLNPSADNAFVASGGAVVQANCGIIVNSNKSKALVASGGSCVSGTEVLVVGNYTQGSCPITPTPKTGVAPTPDPLLSLPAPTVGACNYTNFTLTSATQTLNPGVYCGGITNSGKKAIFNPGTYILAGGGYTQSGGSGQSVGTGVFFYNTQKTGYSYKPITISGGGSANLSAPTSGTYSGILFYQDRTISSSSKNTVSGGSTSKFEGTLYFPTTDLVYSGGSTASTNYTTIVAWTVEFSGSSRLDNKTGTLVDGSATRAIGIQE